MEINFKANFINHTSVKKMCSDTGKYIPKEVSFVKLDLSSRSDMDVLSDLSKKWKYSLVSDIKRDVLTNKDLKVFALTEQRDKFEKLDSHKILGMAELEDKGKKTWSLEYLQVNPDFEHIDDIDKPFVKGTGSAIINSIKQLKDVNEISTTALFSAIDFYIKNQFKFVEGMVTDMLWKK